VLLRMRGWRLLVLGFVIAAAEQALLFPLRRLADIDSRYLPADDRLVEFGILVMVGLFTEVAAIAVLGGVAARQAPRALLGWAAPSRPRPHRTASVVTVAVITGLICGLTAWPFLFLPQSIGWAGIVLAIIMTVMAWPFAYGPIGMAAPIVVTDELNPFRAFGRSIRLSTRSGLRGLWIRVMGYVTWIVIRYGLALGTLAIIELFATSPSNTVDNLIMGGTWLIVNTLIYPTLGSLDVALHLETRMRTEGLDIALRRAIHRGVAPDAVLGVPR